MPPARPPGDPQHARLTRSGVTGPARPARHRPGDGLADRGGREHEARRAVRPGLLLDVQQDGEARHPVREARRQLCGDDARDPVGAQEFPISRHLTTVSIARWGAPQASAGHTATRPRHAGARFPQPNRCRWPSLASHLWTDACRSGERRVIQAFSGCRERGGSVDETVDKMCCTWGER